MYLICPNCAVSYTVDGVNIGSEGRAVRCSECGHTWKQFPAPAEPVRAMKPSVSESPDVARQPVSQESSATFDPEQQLPPVESPLPPQYPPPFPFPPPYPMPPSSEAEGGQPPPYPYPYPYPYPPPYPPPAGQGVEQASLPTEKLPQPETPSEAVTASPQQSDEEVTASSEVQIDQEQLPSDEELDEVLGTDDDIKPIESATPQSNEEAQELSEEDLESLQDPDPIDGIDDGAGGTLEEPDTEPEDLPDPEPIPTAGVEEDEVEKKRSFKGIILSLIIVFLLAGIVAGLIFTRQTVVSFWPGANGALYDWMGLRVPQPGDGLELSLKSPQRKTEDGKDIILFEVIIQNTTDQTQRVPTVISTLTNEEGEQVQEIINTPTQATLEAGKIMRFMAKFPNAPASARQSDAKWGDYPSTSGENNKNQ